MIEEKMKQMKHLSRSPQETSNLAKLFAQELLKTKPEKYALVIGFIGELGTGKTTFIRSFLRASGVKARIVSPTFIFSRRYKSRLKYYQDIWHFDVYRLGSPREVREIGLREAVSQDKNLVIVEWADKVKGLLPKGTVWVEFKHGVKSNERHITFNRR
ncbi:MAG: tRNA (adenosine(37)-N6)-threonylcarbamoyltransferase complex ATPase subunit type 1 TsaE [Candidatus Colwellbacteria bacterium]